MHAEPQRDKTLNPAPVQKVEVLTRSLPDYIEASRCRPELILNSNDRPPDARLLGAGDNMILLTNSSKDRIESFLSDLGYEQRKGVPSSIDRWSPINRSDLHRYPKVSCDFGIWDLPSGCSQIQVVLSPRPEQQTIYAGRTLTVSGCESLFPHRVHEGRAVGEISVNLLLCFNASNMGYSSADALTEYHRRAGFDSSDRRTEHERAVIGFHLLWDKDVCNFLDKIVDSELVALWFNNAGPVDIFALQNVDFANEVSVASKWGGALSRPHI